MKIKDKIKRLTAVLCAVLVGCLSCIPAFASHIPNDKPTSEYITFYADTYTFSVNSIDDIYNNFGFDNLPFSTCHYNTNTGEWNTYNLTTIENWFSTHSNVNEIVFYLENKSGDVTIRSFVYDPNEIKVTYDGTNLIMQNIASETVNFVYCDMPSFVKTEAGYSSSLSYSAFTSLGNLTTTSTYKYPNNSNYTPLKLISSNADIYDSEGNIVAENTSKPNITFTFEPHTTFNNNGITDCYFDFRIESNKNILAMLELYEGDNDESIANGNIWLNDYSFGKSFVPNKSPIYRYNYSENLSEKQKVKVALNYNQMLDREFPDQIQWWVQFFKTDQYSISNGVTDDDLNAVISAIENRDDWVTYWVSNLGGDKPPYTAEKVYQYLKWRTTDKLFNLDLFIGNFGNALENRAKNSLQIISVYADNMQNKVMYSASMLVVGGSNKHGTIYAKNIDYEPNKNYYWVLTYELVDVTDVSALTERYLQNPLYADYSVWYAPNQKLTYEPLPYGNGLSGQQNIYDESGNLFGTMNDDVIDVNPDNENIKNEFGDLGLNTSDLESLFNSSGGFFDFLKKGFSILPSFIWLLIGGFITVLIFLRVMGR